MIPPPLPRLHLLIDSSLLPPLLLHLRLDLFPSPLLTIHQHLHRLPSPRFSKLFVRVLHLLTIDRQLAFPHQQHTSVRYAFIECRALLLVHEFVLGFLETVEGVGGTWVRGLVGMDEERFLSVA